MRAAIPPAVRELVDQLIIVHAHDLSWIIDEVLLKDSGLRIGRSRDWRLVYCFFHTARSERTYNVVKYAIEVGGFVGQDLSYEPSGSNISPLTNTGELRPIVSPVSRFECSRCIRLACSNRGVIHTCNYSQQWRCFGANNERRFFPNIST